MASALKNLSTYDENNIPDAANWTFGIVVSDWNKDITHALYEAAYETLIKHGAKEADIQTIQVPGTFELPTAARMLNQEKKLDAIICLGCVIKGETDHDIYINQAVAKGIMNLGIATGRPHIFGVLTPNTHEQAKDRAGGKYGNKGVEAAVTALRMVAIKKSFKGIKKSIGFGS